LNDKLKAAGQPPIEPAPTKVAAQEPQLGSGRDSASGRPILPADFRLLH